ncbi:TPA: filamentous hemagglutinin N-terminal domain-containing protein [Morganella morganii]|nr:filamentous hemagglutinin N-terminal domain-containing protein [Morganella morganii]
MKKNGLLLSMLVLSPLSLANTTDINVVNDAENLSHNGDQSIVTILKKDSSNLSHIKYDKFNVGSEGMIFNNHLGADTIINEVISQSASELNGEVRIEGKKAKFTLVNPNGITCESGCSFSNTTSANLVVGRKMLTPYRIIGGFARDRKLIIKNTTKKIAENLILDSPNIEIRKSHITADKVTIYNTYNYLNNTLSRANITIDDQSKIEANEIKINILGTDFINNGIVSGKIKASLSFSNIVNNGYITGTSGSEIQNINTQFSGKGNFLHIKNRIPYIYD